MINHEGFMWGCMFVLREAIATGDTVEQAFEKACQELGVPSHEAEIDILNFPVKKTLGIFGGSPARVRAFIKTSPATAAAEYLKSILEQMGIHGTEITIHEEENGAQLQLKGEDIGFIIGHRGETLDALQYLSGLVANHVDNSYYRITLDVGNYREKRKETLENLGRRMAEKAVRNKRNFSLEPMNPYERRIIHTAVQTVEGAKSWSEGEESARHVVVGPVDGEVKRRGGYDDRRRGGYKGKSRGGKSGGRSNDNRRGPRSSASANKPAGEKPVENKTDAGAALLYGKIDVANKE